MTQRPPGWYRYPGDPTGHRYWNGTEWGAHESLTGPEPRPADDEEHPSGDSGE